MMVEIDVSDEITPFIRRTLEHNKSYMRHITKSLGYMYQKETKDTIKLGAPNGETYLNRIPYKIRKALDDRASRVWYGRLRSAIGYEYIGNGTVAIGWTSYTASRYGHLQEKGFTRSVTPAMRKKWASAGYPLREGKTELKIPARPVFEPMSKQIRPKIVPYVEEKLINYINENVAFGKKKNERRVYKVYK